MNDRERAIAWRHAQHAAVCDHMREWEHGTAVYASRVPGFWTYNSVRVEGPDPGLGAAELAAVADRLQRGLRHRHVEVEDEAAGGRVRPGFERLGWFAERLVWMQLDGPPRGTPAPLRISEVPFARTRPLREAWTSTAEWAADEEAVTRFAALEEEVAGRRGARALAAWDDDGEPIGFAAFAEQGGTAEVEQVYVDPALRGHGTGGALVAAAVAAAGAGVTFIVADDEGDPKRLYARLGFRPVWVQHVFTRRPE